MIRLYYHPISANSRRVWIALLEKHLPFELVPLNLDGDQYQADFLSLNPFRHVPVLVDAEVRIIESIAILDYLEAKYPIPAMLPTDAKAIAMVRMIQMVTLTELIPATLQWTSQILGFVEADIEKQKQTKQKIDTVLTFFQQQLGDCHYLGGNDLSLADLTAGTIVPGLPELEMSLDGYPSLKAWAERLSTRPSWQQTQPTPETIAAFLPQMKALMTTALT
jgi:glutathione S-transferase